MIRQPVKWEINLFVAGYVTAMQDKGRLLTDVEYDELDPEYRRNIELVGESFIAERLKDRNTDPMNN